MTRWLDPLRDVILPVLLALAAGLAVLFIWLLAWRLVVHLHAAWKRHVQARYRSSLNEILGPRPAPHALRRLARSPRRYRPAIGDLIIDALRVTTGDIVPRLRHAVHELGLSRRWHEHLIDRRWWRRAEAARALGLVRDQSAFGRLVAALDDPHEEVRAAAVDALGRLADGRAIPALLARLPDETRYQRARLVEAICRLGSRIVPALLEHARAHPRDRVLAVDVLGMTGATGALDELLAWSGEDDPAIRGAALRAVGSIGLDDRSFYYALRGLEDGDAGVRSMAARALGRSGREAAVPYLARRLGDDWVVAAHAARGLRRLGRSGAAALEAQVDSPGQAGDLARQMVWEISASASARDHSGALRRD